jgi:hypothetical protein
LEIATMGVTTAQPPKPRNKLGRPKRQSDLPDPKGITIRGSAEWRQWITELAEFRRSKITDMVDQAIVEYAERHGFKKTAPKR